MATYRIVCTVQLPANHPTTNAHIVEVGTGDDPAKASKRWKLDEVIAAIDRGDIFYTQGERSGKIAYVEKWYCAYCSRYYIRSKPDAVTDNNLDSLRICRWE
jgi:hypothetical protein